MLKKKKEVQDVIEGTDDRGAWLSLEIRKCSPEEMVYNFKSDK